MGKKAIDDKLMSMDLPMSIRRLVLSGSRLQVEGPRLGLTEKLKSAVLPGEKDAAEEKPRLRLLPRIRFSEREGISPKRMQEIRSRIRASYKAIMDAGDNEELRTLNARMSRDISQQIEKRLKELAEQVEIPL